MQAPQEPTPQDPKGTQTNPQQVADHERQYMELQAAFAQMRQRTIAESQKADQHIPHSPKHQLACRLQARLLLGKPTLYLAI